MDNLIWKLKSLIRQLLPMALIGAVLYGGYLSYKEGAFRRGIGSGITHMLGKVPVFGSHLKRYSSQLTKSSSPKSYKRGKGYRRRHRRH